MSAGDWDSVLAETRLGQIMRLGDDVSFRIEGRGSKGRAFKLAAVTVEKFPDLDVRVDTTNRTRTIVDVVELPIRGEDGARLIPDLVAFWQSKVEELAPARTAAEMTRDLSKWIAQGIELDIVDHSGDAVQAMTKLADLVGTMGFDGVLRALGTGAETIVSLDGDALALGKGERESLRAIRTVLAHAVIHAEEVISQGAES